MGECFITVNPVKRQYVTHSRLPFNSRFSGLLCAIQGLSLGLLACDLGPEHNVHPLMGTWAGDPVIVAGDDFGEIDAAGFTTTTEEDQIRNMHWMARETFEDITFPCIAMLCAFDAHMADHLALLINRKRTKESKKPDIELLGVLTELAESTQCQPLRDALQRAVESAERDDADCGEWNERTAATPEFVVVNIRRKEFLDPDRIRLRSKSFRLLDGAARLLQGPTAYALGLTLTDTNNIKLDALDYGFHRLWLGDPIVVAFKDSPPNGAGIDTITGDNPQRNLYQMAQDEFEDLSGRAMTVLMRGPTWVTEQPRISAPTL